MPRKFLAGRYLRTTMLTGAAAAVVLPSLAQDYDVNDVIVVTGTRIQREDLNAPSPVTTISSEQLVVANTVNSEQFLNTLPQVVPSFDATSNNPGDGSARVDLRGLGANRTLVLVDSARFVGLGPSFIVDLNNIPSALIEQIDVVTGGASAVYGSDAVTGVVNFILKTDFEGIQLDVSNEMSAVGWDANTFNAALTAGGNFADSRGNAVVFASYTNRKSLQQGDRDFSAFTFRDLGVGNESAGFILAGSPSIPGGAFTNFQFNSFGLENFDELTGNRLPSTNTNFPATATITDIDPLCGAAGTVCGGVRIGSPGVVNGFRFVVPGGQATDEYNYAPSNYLQLPQERYNISGFVSYEINNHIEAYLRGVFSNTIVDSQLAPTPAFLLLTINNDNPLLPATLRSLITGSTANNGDGTSTLFINKRYEELGTRNALRDTTGIQILTGLRGDLSQQWSYDTYFNFSRSTVSQIQTGNFSQSALRAALLCDGGPSAIASGCTAPTVDLFGGPGSISPSAAAFIIRTGARFDEIEQTQWVGTLAGDLDGLRMPWAENGTAVVFGLEYRELFARSVPDSVLGPDVRGFDPSLPVGGRYDVYEAFGEVQLPIITGKPLIENLVLNGAYRYSDYSLSNVGGVHTFAAGGDWEVTPGLRFRAQFQRAVRAPNIGELFTARMNRFPAVSDPCSSGPNGSFSTATIISTCIATGVPPANVGANIQPLFGIEDVFGGNSNLSQETADTLTVGMVWQPEAIDHLSLQVDYYDIDIKDAISQVPLFARLHECHVLGVAASCNALADSRDPVTGIMGFNNFLPFSGSVNLAVLNASGIDLNIGYNSDVFGGNLLVRYYGTYTLKKDLQSAAGAPIVSCAGHFNFCGEPTPKYKHTMQVSFNQGPLTASVRWRVIGEVTIDATTLQFSPFLSDLSDNIPLTNYVDATTQFAVNENLDLTLGVRNITGKDAPLLGGSESGQANTYPATYTPFGRQVFFGASIRF